MVAAETSTSSSNGMGEELPLRIRFQRTFNLARMSLVSPWRDWLLPSRARSEDAKIFDPPNLAFAEHLKLLFRDRAVAVRHIPSLQANRGSTANAQLFAARKANEVTGGVLAMPRDQCPDSGGVSGKRSRRRR
jgi:hypothetical protein